MTTDFVVYDFFEVIKQAIMAMPLDEPESEKMQESTQTPFDEQFELLQDDPHVIKLSNLEDEVWDIGGVPSSPSPPSSEDEVDDIAFNDDYEIRPSGCKGLGIFALRDMEPTDIICQEKALFTCPSGAHSPEEMEEHMHSAMQYLSSRQREFVFHGLLNANNDKNHLAGCFRTNALPCGRNGGRGAIFAHLSMANHSCAPNAEYYWNTDDSCGMLRALEPIAAGSEVTISYIDMAPHSARRTRLQESFGFLCDCPLCSLGEERREAEDARIREIESLELTLFSNSRRLAEAPDENLCRFGELLKLYEESEVSHESDLLRLCAEVVRLCISCYDARKAVEKVTKTCKIPREAAVEACISAFD